MKRNTKQSSENNHMCISHVSFSYFFHSYGTKGLTQLVSMRHSLKLILCDFLLSRCDFKNESVQLRAAGKVCYNAECLECSNT